MKKWLSFIFLVLLFFCTYFYRKEIVTVIVDTLGNIQKEVILTEKNEYYRDYNLSYVKTTDNFKAKDKTDLMNMYYTIINSGVNEFTFYCSKTYPTCIEDVLSIANNQILLSNINSFVSPYNSFTTVKTEYDTLNRVTIKVQKTYTNENMKEINKVLKEIETKYIKNESDKREIIKAVHDYIIDNTKYDKDRADRNIIKYQSNTAYGIFVQGYGLCGGYTDAMAIFLDKYNIPNFKVTSENHIWNAVFLDNEWYHLDLTWDDPVMDDGTDALEYTFFLITTSELEKLETNQHIFDKNTFSELANNKVKEKSDD